MPEIGTIYKHYKNHQNYQVIAIGKHSETLEDMVIYKGTIRIRRVSKRPNMVQTIKNMARNHQRRTKIQENLAIELVRAASQ